MRPKPEFPTSFLSRLPKAVRLWWFRLHKQPHCVECGKRLDGFEFLRAGVGLLELLKGSGFPCPRACKSKTRGCQNGHLGSEVSQ